MTREELAELKIQLKDLLNKGYSRPILPDIVRIKER
jgi:hypothetical protein